MNRSGPLTRQAGEATFSGTTAEAGNIGVTLGPAAVPEPAVTAMVGVIGLLPLVTVPLNPGKNLTVTDGPFTETKEVVAGFALWEVKSFDEALEWARKCPVMMDCTVEMRPVF